MFSVLYPHIREECAIQDVLTSVATETVQLNDLLRCVVMLLQVVDVL